jgi:integrase
VSIYRRRSGRYAVLIDLEPTATGLRCRKSIGTYRTKKEAEAAERTALQARDRGIDLSPANVTLSTVFDRFIESVTQRLAPETVAGYAELWRLHAASKLGGIALGKLRAAHLQQLYAELNHKESRSGKVLSAARVYAVHRMLHRVLRWAERTGLAEHNVARHVEPPTLGPSSARAITAEEAARILEYTKGTRPFFFFVVAIATGMRRGELCALRWPGIDLDRAIATVSQATARDRRGGERRYYLKATKTNRERCVPLSAAAVDALRAIKVRQAHERLAAGALYQDRGFVFADELGDPYTPESATKAFAKAVRALRIDGVTLHSCRHAVATWALAVGADLHSVAAVLGHRAASTTLNLYGHVVSGGKERAVGMAADVLATAQERLATGPNPGGLEATNMNPLLEAPAKQHGNQMATAADFREKRKQAGDAKIRMK